jgi:hypothetical protein
MDEKPKVLLIWHSMRNRSYDVTVVVGILCKASSNTMKIQALLIGTEGYDRHSLNTYSESQLLNSINTMCGNILVPSTNSIRIQETALVEY